MATTTPQFGWAVPTSTDYVKDGALAIETLGDAIDARFGNAATFPNQIVNVVSGVSRPIAYASNAQTGNTASIAAGATGTLVFTLPASRFTQAPIVAISSTFASSSSLINIRVTAVTTTSVTVSCTNGTGAALTFTINMIALQMTSAAAAG